MAPMFVPGPVDVAPQVLAAQARPMLPHRSPEFEALFQRTAEKLQKVFFTSNHIFQAACSGSGMQEAAIRNFIEQNVLCLVNGAFSERWFAVAEANGRHAERLEVEWGQAVTPDMLGDALHRRHFEAVTIVHNETSTGVENPLPELAAVVREVSPETLILVDAVSSLGGVKIEMDAWGIDFLFTASQKCLALPPGMAFASASERAMKKAATVQNRGWYFDLLLMEKHRQKDSTPMTPAMALVFALDVQLDRIFSEGLENRFARHAALAGQVAQWGLENALDPLAPHTFRSKTVTALQNSQRLDIAALNQFLLTRNMRIANGYGKIKDVTFRIATMGETQQEDLQNLLAALNEFLGVV